MHSRRNFGRRSGLPRTVVAVLCLLLAQELGGSAASAGAGRAGPLPGDNNPFANLEPVGDADLAEMRGGFIAGGLNISFGIEVLSLVNGTPVIQYNFGSSDLIGSLPAPPPGLDHIVTHNGLQNVVQVGPDNIVMTSFQGFDGLLTVIQNTLDNTVIQHFSLVTIDISNVDLGLFPLQNLNLSLGF